MTTDHTMARARLQRSMGFSLVELLIVCVVAGGILVALSQTVSLNSNAALGAIHLETARSENRRILDVIAAEIAMTTSERTHSEPSNFNLPLPRDTADAFVCEAYNFPGVAVGNLHNTMERDGAEYWHPTTDARRFFIYATVEPFDTFEFQRVRVPKSNDAMVEFLGEGGEINLPWSSQRKIMKVGDKVVLRVLADPAVPGDFEDHVIGSGVDSLKFHLNADNEFIVEVVTRSGKNPQRGSADEKGALVFGTRIVTPIGDK